MLVRPESRRRECEEELRQRRDANMTLAGVDGGAHTGDRGVAGRVLLFSLLSEEAAQRDSEIVARHGGSKKAQNASSSLSSAA
eukprot:3644541-Pleurochrysis_carterae.AAC.3